MKTEWVEKIKGKAESQGGVISTQEIEAMGICRVHIKKFLESGLLTSVCKGLYTLTDGFVDEYAVLQKQSGKIVFGYGTALFLLELSDRVPQKFDVVVPTGTNLTRLCRQNENVRCHYVNESLHGLGVMTMKTSYGNDVRLYNAERCICDLIRQKARAELELYRHALKTYFSNQFDARKLFKMARLFNVEKEVRTYSDVLA